MAIRSIPDNGIRSIPDEDTQAPETNNWLTDIASDIDIGRARMLQGLQNLPYNIVKSREKPFQEEAQKIGKTYPSFAEKIPHSTEDVAAPYGGEPTSLGGKLLTGASQFAPYGLIPAEGAEITASKGIPFLSKMIQAGTRQVPGAAAFGFTQSEDPLQGALESSAAGLVGGAVLNPIERGIGAAIGTKRSKQDLMNGILRYVRNQATKAGANLPHEAASDLMNQFVNEKGEALPIDIGQLSNNPFLKNLYNAVSYAPFNKGLQNRNIVRQGILGRERAEAGKELTGLKLNPPEMAQDEQTQLGKAIEQKQQEAGMHQQKVESANPLVNGLISHLEDKSDVVGSVKNNATKSFKADKEASDKLYEPINNSKLQIDKLAPNNRFTNYRSAAIDLMAQRKNLEDLFGSDSDMGSMLNGELNKAENLLNNEGEFAETLPLVVKRVKNLRKLSAAAYDAGRFNESRLLNQLGEGLHQDTLDVLNQSGNNDLATGLTAADANYKKNMVPWFGNREIRQTVTRSDYRPKPDAIAKAFHDPNNRIPFNKLSNNDKDALLNMRLTKGQISTSGKSNIEPTKLATRYGNLTQPERQAIESHNPKAARLLENLTQHINDQKNAERETTILENQKSKLEKSTAKTKEKYENELKMSEERLKQAMGARLTRPRASPFTNVSPTRTFGQLALLEALHPKFSLVSGLGPLSMVPGISRTLEKVLSDPDLINAYISGRTIQAPKAGLASKLANLMITPNISGNR